MNQENNLTDSTDAFVPIGKNVIEAFTKSAKIAYANHDNGSLYISNGYFIMKADRAEFDDLIEQVNKRVRSAHDKKTPVEKPELLRYVSSEKGKFELSGEPLEFESSDNNFISLFADDKQYFGYNKKYVDVFKGSENRLFVDDNTVYDTLSHCMIVKSHTDEILGAILPIRLSDLFYEEMADVMPLKVKWKTELERIKENLTNDPYIGKEFYDGRDTHIISSLKEVNGAYVYTVPNVLDGMVSRYAAYVDAGDIENQIKRWEADRTERESDNPTPVEKAAPDELEESKPPVRPFTHLRNSPWGEVQSSEKLCPGVYMVSAENQSGIMVTRDMTAAFSPIALKCGVKYKDYVCFEDNGAKDVALRELLDKKLLTITGDAKDRAAYEESINKSLQDKQPQYWRSRENRRELAMPQKAAATHDDR